MPFFQNFNLNTGQTIRSSRGFKWNNTQEETGISQDPPTPQNNKSIRTPLKVPPHTPNGKQTQQTQFNSPLQLKQPLQQPQLPHLHGQPQQPQIVTDYNYTPTHQKPYIQPPENTVVSSHQDLKHVVEMTLGSDGVLNQAVKLPKGEDINEWMALHCVDFYNQINMLYGAITEFCSPQSCPRMIATNEYEYLWSFQKNEPPVSIPSPQYVEALMRWCQNQFDDEAIFPSKITGSFPSKFIERYVVPMLRRLFRVYAHIYCHHFNEILELNLQTVLNTSFKHFCLFAQEFQLLKSSDYGPLLELVVELRDK